MTWVSGLLRNPARAVRRFEKPAHHREICQDLKIV
jgi:hypothetical protein